MLGRGVSGRGEAVARRIGELRRDGRGLGERGAVRLRAVVVLEGRNAEFIVRVQTNKVCKNAERVGL